MTIPDTGLEWIVDARGCPAAALADLPSVRGCCERIVQEMNLHVVGQPQWRQFDGPGGVTGLYLLSESHLSVHTFPEFGLVCLNVYCCRPRTAPGWETLLREELGATAVVVRELTRGLCERGGDPQSMAGSGDAAATESVVGSGDPSTPGGNPSTTGRGIPVQSASGPGGGGESS